MGVARRALAGLAAVLFGVFAGVAVLAGARALRGRTHVFEPAIDDLLRPPHSVPPTKAGAEPSGPVAVEETVTQLAHPEAGARSPATEAEPARSRVRGIFDWLTHPMPDTEELSQTPPEMDPLMASQACHPGRPRKPDSPQAQDGHGADAA